jgi:hypothetical protein
MQITVEVLKAVHNIDGVVDATLSADGTQLYFHTDTDPDDPEDGAEILGNVEEVLRPYGLGTNTNDCKGCYNEHMTVEVNWALEDKKNALLPYSSTAFDVLSDLSKEWDKDRAIWSHTSDDGESFTITVKMKPSTTEYIIPRRKAIESLLKIGGECTKEKLDKLSNEELLKHVTAEYDFSKPVRIV